MWYMPENEIFSFEVSKKTSLYDIFTEKPEEFYASVSFRALKIHLRISDSPSQIFNYKYKLVKYFNT